MLKSKVLLFLVLVIFSGICFGDMIRFDMSFDSHRVEIESYESYHIIRYADSDAYSFVKEGEPDIPAYMIRVLVPVDSEITGIKADRRNRINLGNVVPYPFQGYHPISKPSTDFIEPDKKVYDSGLVFPADNIIMHSMGRTRGFYVFYFTYIPFEYDTGSQDLYLYEDVSFEVRYGHRKENNRLEYRANNVFNEMVMSSVINPYDLKEFYPEKVEPVRKSTDYDMLIITTDTFLSAAHSYAAYREASAGIISAIKTVSTIDSEYSGSTIQLKIKNCIYDYVQNNNISYVFLIGDAGSNATYSVPDQKVYVSYSYYNDNTVPGDIFYSCFDLQFDWNANGNTRVGEMSVDNADISPDVLIGRLPVRTSQQITDYMNKVETYIGASTDSAFVENLLLAGVKLWNTGDAEIKSEKMYNEYIAPYWDYHQKHTLYDSVTTVSVATLSAKLNESMNFFHMATHGDVTVYSMGTGSSFNSTNALALNNIPGTVITIACITNAFDPEVSGASDPCLGEAFVRNPDGGSVVYIGSSRYGWGTPSPMDAHGPSFQYNDRIFQYILQDTFDHNIGSAFTQAKIDLVGEANSDGVMRWVHFALNYLGDPSLIAYKEVAGAVAPPSNFTAEGVSTSQIDLSWQKNDDNNNVMVVWSSDQIFGTPTDGTVYNVGSTLPGGGTVLYRGSATSYSHTSLSSNTVYYYRAFSYNSFPEYSAGRNTNAATLCGVIDVLPFSEDFNASTNLPLCWDIVDHQGNGQVWQFGTISSGLSGTTGNYAYLNSDGYGYSGSQNTDLVTPVLDLTNYTNVQISFTHYFRHYSSSSATFSYSINNGNTWTQVQSWTSTTSNPAYFSQIIPQVAGQSLVRFKWNFTGSWGYYWCVDDVLIDGDFTGEYYTLSLYADPDDIGVNLTGAGEHASGSNVNISASIPEGYMFIEWTGNPEDISLLNSHTSASTFFTMPARNVSLTAVFQEGSTIIPVPVYRFFNTIRGGHLYTISEIEKNYILENLPEWNYEGVKFYVYEEQAEGTTDTFRFFNTITGIHLYTISEIERDYIIDNLPEWNYEGIKFYVYEDFAPDSTPVYRFFNHVHGGHLYTISDAERDDVMELPEWTYEGVKFYVYEFYK